MCYPVSGMVYIEPFMLIGKSSQYGGSGFPLDSVVLFHMFDAIQQNVLSASLNKTLSSLCQTNNIMRL